MANEKRSREELSSPEDINSKKVRKKNDGIPEELFPVISFVETIQKRCSHKTIKKVYGCFTEIETKAKENIMGGSNLLWIASSMGNIEIVNLLIESGVNIDQPDENNVTPLMVASRNMHYNVLCALLKANAKTDAEDNNGCTALHMAAHIGNSDIIEALVNCNKELLNKKNKDKESALYIAAAHGQCKAVKKLLDLNADVNQVEKIKKFTVLHAAADGGYNEVLELLLQNKVLLSMINVTDERWNRTPILLASWKGNTKCVQLLCDMKADISIKTKGGYTPMHWAAALGRTEVIKILYKEKADITALNGAMETPLDLAKRAQHRFAVELLMDYEAEQNRLLSAIKNANVAELERLLAHGKNINFKCHLDANPAEFDKLECDHSEILRTVRSTDTVMKSNWQNIALLLESYKGNAANVSYLLDIGADINTRTKCLWTPLMIASEQGNEDVVQHLLVRGAKVEVTTEWGQSAVLFAAWGNHDKVLEALIKKRPDMVDKKTDGGWTAYQWAVTLGHEKAKLVLEKHNASIMPNEKSKDSLGVLENRYGTILKNHRDVFLKTRDASMKWRNIGRELKFEIDELDSITKEPGRHGDDDYYEAMLKRWMSREKAATAEQLSDALRSCYVHEEKLAYNFLEEMKN